MMYNMCSRNPILFVPVIDCLVSQPNSNSWWNPKVTIFGDRAFMEVFKVEWDHKDRISIFIRRYQRAPLPSHTHTRRGHGAHSAPTYKPGDEASDCNLRCQHLDFGLPNLQNSERINFCCLSHPVYSILL